MAVSRYWRRIPQYYRLVGSRCECSKMHFPPREICSCGKETKEHQFEGKGTIITYTTVRVPMNDSEGEVPQKPSRSVPYVLAVIRLDEGPMLTAEVVDSDPPKIGDRVEMVFRKLQEDSEHGVIQYGYKFRCI